MSHWVVYGTDKGGKFKRAFTTEKAARRHAEAIVSNGFTVDCVVLEQVS